MSDLVFGILHATTLVIEGVLSVYARVTDSEAETDNDADDERSTADADGDC